VPLHFGSGHYSEPFSFVQGETIALNAKTAFGDAAGMEILHFVQEDMGVGSQILKPSLTGFLNRDPSLTY